MWGALLKLYLDLRLFHLIYTDCPTWRCSFVSLLNRLLSPLCFTVSLCLCVCVVFSLLMKKTWQEQKLQRKKSIYLNLVLSWMDAELGGGITPIQWVNMPFQSVGSRLGYPPFPLHWTLHVRHGQTSHCQLSVMIVVSPSVHTAHKSYGISSCVHIFLSHDLLSCCSSFAHFVSSFPLLLSMEIFKGAFFYWRKSWTLVKH